METSVKSAADIIRNSSCLIALTGAGISVESGIPDFRSAGGLWSKYDPEIYANIDTFRRSPEKCWEMIFETLELTVPADPNPAHRALAELEDSGLLKAVITQNIDSLHQKAGSRNVIEYHGSGADLVCLKCGAEYSMKEFEDDRIRRNPPLCRNKGCGAVLKPSIIFFGEMIPEHALYSSAELAEKADAVLIVGTSAVVYPAAAIPPEAKRHGAKIIECNLEKTGFTRSITDVFLQGKAGEILPELVKAVKNE